MYMNQLFDIKKLVISFPLNFNQKHSLEMSDEKVKFLEA